MRFAVIRRALPPLLLLPPLAWAVPAAGATPAPTTGTAAVAPPDLCRAAVAQAEREAGLPPRLLAAIARVESGRRDPGSGGFGPWPWTINAEGRGSFFPDRAAAVAAVRSLQAAGVRSIDVGCMQINLRHHPGAFSNLEEAFDPLANARYAARFLTSLQATRNDWMRSAGHYHSQTPDLAEAYRARVAAALEAERGAPDPRPLPVGAPPAAGAIAVAARTAPSLLNRPERAAMLAEPAAPMGLVGRGLDAYRALPIPVAGRAIAPPTAIATAPAGGGRHATTASLFPAAAPVPASRPPGYHFLAAGRP